ncbi:hypothetical protein D3C73_1441250 [compost metagenome]
MAVKTYHTPTQLRIVGKAYEVRWQLRKLLDTAGHPHEPLLRRLSEWRPCECEPVSAGKVIPFPSAKRY